MRIAFVWDWKPNFEQTIQWNDGLSAALKQLEIRGHRIGYFTDTDVVVPHGDTFFYPIDTLPDTIDDFDVILHWADFTRPHAKEHRNFGKPMAICFAGGEAINYNTPYFDHIFVESEVYKEKLNSGGYDNVSIAFGTNTELFTPTAQAKIFDTIFPATFAKWKRHDLYASATRGLRSLACGYMYPDSWERECYEDCIKEGTVVLPHVSAEVLHRLYASSKVVVVTSMSSGGSQRTVLEAMAMNIPLIVTDSDKFDYARGHVYEADPTTESIRGYINAILDGETEVNTRDYVVTNWSEYTYADSLEEGLKSIL